MQMSKILSAVLLSAAVTQTTSCADAGIRSEVDRMRLDKGWFYNHIDS